MMLAGAASIWVACGDRDNARGAAFGLALMLAAVAMMAIAIVKDLVR